MPDLSHELSHERAAHGAGRGGEGMAERGESPDEVLPRSLVLASTVEGLADLALDARPLRRLPGVTEGLRVGCHRQLVVLQRLGVGGDAPGLVAGLEEVLLGLLPVLGLRVVVGEKAGEVLETVREQQPRSSAATLPCSSRRRCFRMLS